MTFILILNLSLILYDEYMQPLAHLVMTTAPALEVSFTTGAGSRHPTDDLDFGINQLKSFSGLNSPL